MRTEIKEFGFDRYQFFTHEGERYFGPHYESDQYTSAELRLIADHMDAQGIETRSATDPKGRRPEGESPVPEGNAP